MIRTVIVFARKPELGKVKTRLAKTIGKQNALSIYNNLLEITLKAVYKADVVMRIYWSKKKDKKDLFIQSGTDLGERMHNALNTEIAKSSKVCLVGTDTPLLSTEIIHKSFDYLDSSDIVFGPSVDGGYYLIAIKQKIHKDLLLQKHWSHKNVLNNAINVCRRRGLSYKLLSTLLDIDTYEDYKLWQNIKNTLKNNP